MSSILGGGFALLASFFKSGSELTSKLFLNEELNPYVAAFGYRAFAIPVLSILLFIFGIPNIESTFWIALVAGGILNIGASILYMKALKLSDISIVSPIKAMAPMALLITSPIMINEYASPTGAIGVVFVTAGVYMLKVTKDQNSVWTPFLKLKNEKGARFAFYVMLIYSVTSNIDKVGVEASSPIFWTFATHVFISIGIFLIVIYVTDDGVSEIKSNWKKLLPMGSLSGLGVAAQMTALTYTLVAYVIAIKRTALIWNILGGTLFLDEQGIKKRLPGGILIVIGVIIISTAL